VRPAGEAWASALAVVNSQHLGEQLSGRRLTLRPLRAGDYRAWLDVRTRAHEWLVHWEPRRAGVPYPAEDRSFFAARCSMRERDRQLGTAYSFGIFAGRTFVGEINLSSIQRGAAQSAYLGYWVDEAHAGRGYVPEACVVVFGFAFDELGLHRVQVAIIPRNHPSRRVAEKLGLVEEGLARGYLEIDGVWEDHVRYAITAEDWRVRREALRAEWISPRID
jgi:ribosomal-protein-alanine N-acetyltransferase